MIAMGKDVDLMQAIRDEDLTAVLKILNRTKAQRSKLIGSVKKLNVNFQDAAGMSALHQAALSGNGDIMKALLEHGATVDITDTKNMRPLHYAAWQGKDNLVDILLEYGSNVNQAASDGNTPLHLASEHGHFCVVKKLLDAGANPTLTNEHHRTPLDVACEFGRIRVVEFLLDSELTQSLIDGSPAEDTLNNERTTCLHLAARNGHVDIIRLLLEAGIDINRQTLQGTCLHEAAMFGKTEVVALLLSSGIDVNRLNSYEQTALEVVNKFTATRGAREIKQLLREASSNLRARAVKDYCNLRESSHISFREGDLITVTEQHPTSGLWKGFKCTYNGVMTRPGYFPASTVVLMDPHTITDRKSAPCGMSHQGQSDGTWARNHHMSSSVSASPFCEGVGRDEHFPLPPSPHAKTKNIASEGGLQNGLSKHQMQPMSPLQCSCGPHGLTVQADGEIVMSKGSPGGSSHGSGTGSNASTYQMACPACNGGTQLQHRLSGQSCESGVSSSSRQSYHSGASSGSSSSQGSLDRLEESGYSSTINVHELLQQGLTDSEVLRSWLTGLHLEDYYNMFVIAGYDMPTISRMTPEDLTAIGITKPSVRKKLKSEIGKLTISDGIPDYKPHDVQEWLSILHLSEYTDTLVRQGYSDINSITDITWEDLEEIGIRKLGHQKKMMLAIDRLKRAPAGHPRLPGNGKPCPGDIPGSPITRTPLPCRQLGNEVQTKEISGTHIPSVTSVQQPVTPTMCNGSAYRSSSRENSPFSIAAGPPALFTPIVAATNSRSAPNSVSSYGVSNGEPSTKAVPSSANPSTTPAVAFAFRGTPATVVGRGLDSDGDLTPTNERKAVPTPRPVESASHGVSVTRARVSEDGSATVRPAAYVTPSPKPVATVTAKSSASEAAVPAINIEPCSKAIDVAEVPKDNGFSLSSYGTLPRKFSQKRRLMAAAAAADLSGSHGLEYSDGYGNVLAGGKVECSGSVASPAICVTSSSDTGSGDSFVNRKEPPIPPKRTHSFKTEIRTPILNARSSSTVPFNDCLSCNGGMAARMAANPSQLTNTSSSTFVGSMDLFVGSENSLSDVIERLERGSGSTSSSRRNVGPRLGDWQDGRTSNDSSSEDSDSGLESRHSGSATSLASTGGGSMVDTNTLPFANENVGTIKQRGSSSKPSVVSTSDSGAGQLNSDLFAGSSQSSAGNSGSSLSSVHLSASSNSIESDAVFNDIDGMLLGLTAELDEMLKLQG